MISSCSDTIGASWQMTDSELKVVIALVCVVTL